MGGKAGSSDCIIVEYFVVVESPLTSHAWALLSFLDAHIYRFWIQFFES